MTPLSDPASGSPLLDAVAWIQGALLGTIATTMAVLTVATVGAMMLTGRADIRRGATVILGCFILFGASSIAEGLRSLAGGDDQPTSPLPIWSPPPVLPAAPATPTTAYDPYAGAALPRVQ